MHAIEAALEKLRGSLGTDVVDQAVASAGLPAAGYSAAELEWLASWCAVSYTHLTLPTICSV